MTELTLTAVETAIGYTAASAVSEYFDGTYGDERDVDAAVRAEFEGDAGDQISAAFEGADYETARKLYEAGFRAAWDAQSE